MELILISTMTRPITDNKMNKKTPAKPHKLTLCCLRAVIIFGAYSMCVTPYNMQRYFIKTVPFNSIYQVVIILVNFHGSLLNNLAYYIHHSLSSFPSNWKCRAANQAKNSNSYLTNCWNTPLGISFKLFTNIISTHFDRQPRKSTSSTWRFWSWLDKKKRRKRMKEKI